MRHSRNIFRYLRIFSATALLAAATSGCSPGYVMRAGVEQAKILWRRENIAQIISSDKISDSEKQKLELVLEARAFAEASGLTPGKSFLKYSRVDRDVLLWVLSGSAKTSFTPVTWWFPIVGRVPYKGFFDKADGLRELELLKLKNYDAVLRPSPAFSTLGWFDDPLLSTTLKAPETALVNTVLHEIMHSTFWIQGGVSFNESLANALGHLGAIQFFEEHYPSSAWSVEARAEWEDEKQFAVFIQQLFEELDQLYRSSAESKLAESVVLEKRDQIFSKHATSWNEARTRYRTTSMRRLALQFNNAVIIGYRLYLDRLDLFERFFNRYRTNSGSINFPLAIGVLRQIAQDASLRAESSTKDIDPFTLLEKSLEN